MPTISANTTQTITLAASTLMRGIGAAVLSWGTPLQTVTHTAGDEWHLGPFTAAQAVSIHAQSFLTYSTQAVSDDDPVDKLGLKFDGGLTAAQVQAVQAMAAVYDYQPATWHAGELNSVITPSITADGDLTSATDQLPLKWLAVINADDDVAAAQALMDGGPNVIEILPGAQVQKPVYADDGVTPEVITRIYALCISSSAVPADYTGGAYIISDLETDIADVLAQMARLDFSSGLGATVARLVATPVYATNYTQLSVAAGVVA
jgi:hypothetical protein